MARLQATFWHRYKYQLSGVVLVLSAWFFYQSLNPTFPPAWPAKQVGPFTIAPMPFNVKKPYQHHDDYVKDFLLMFEKGDSNLIRQAYVNIGPTALPLAQLQQGENGILHGTKHGQHVHAIAKPELSNTDLLWVSIEDWQGNWSVANWPLPESLIQ